MDLANQFVPLKLKKIAHVVKIIIHYIEENEIFSFKMCSVALFCSHHDWYEQVYELVIIKIHMERDKKYFSVQMWESGKGKG